LLSSPAGSTPLTVCFEDCACNTSSRGNEAKPPVAYKPTALLFDRRRALLQHAFELAGLPYDENEHPFAVVVIRCTCGGDVDNKTISKWSRALRYVARSKEPDTGLWTFMKEAGGVNACACGSVCKTYAVSLNRVQLGRFEMSQIFARGHPLGWGSLRRLRTDVVRKKDGQS
jgi:hypothetical protein